MAQSVKQKRIKRWLLGLGFTGAVCVIQLILHPRPVEAGLLSILDTPVLPLDKIPVSLETPIVEVSVPVPVTGILPELPLLPALEAEIPSVSVEILGVSVETPIVEIEVPAIPVVFTTESAVPLPVPSPEIEPEPVADMPLPIPLFEPAPSAAPDEPDRTESDVSETPASIPPVAEEPPKPAAAVEKPASVQIRKPDRKPSIPAGAPEPQPAPAVELNRMPAAKSEEAGNTGPFPKDLPRRTAKALAWMPGSGTQGSGGTSIAPPGSAPYPPAFGFLLPGDTGKPPRMSIMKYQRFRIFCASQWSKPPPLQPPKTFLLI